MHGQHVGCRTGDIAGICQGNVKVGIGYLSGITVSTNHTMVKVLLAIPKESLIRYGVPGQNLYPPPPRRVHSRAETVPPQRRIAGAPDRWPRPQKRPVQVPIPLKTDQDQSPKIERPGQPFTTPGILLMADNFIGMNGRG